jgi:hypothetical protein
MNDSIAGFFGGSYFRISFFYLVLYIKSVRLGLSGLVIGHPLDTVKALIQTRNHKSLRNSFQILFKNSNVN